MPRKEELINSIAFSIGTQVFTLMGLLQLLDEVNSHAWWSSHNKRITDRSASPVKSRSRSRDRPSSRSKVVCSPLSYMDIQPSFISLNLKRGKIEGGVRRIHLEWDDRSSKLNAMPQFTKHINDCTDATDEGECEFIVMSLGIQLRDLAHANYIIIHSRQAYRIEPHGHNRTSIDDIDGMEVALMDLFSKYDIIYIPHARITLDSSHKHFGLQLLGQMNEITSDPDPLLEARIGYMNDAGLCATFVLLYIKKICAFSMTEKGRELEGIDLISTAIQGIDQKGLIVDAKKLIHRDALLSNQQILQFETRAHAQLLELILADGVTTRGKQEQHSKMIVGQYKKLRKDYFDSSRKQLDVDMYDSICDVFRNWKKFKQNFDILDIYGINFDKLISNMGGIRKKQTKTRKKKKKKKKRKKKDKKTKRRKTH